MSSPTWTSFEIITGSYTRGAYFAGDLRSVTEAGVKHVMQVFMNSFTDGVIATPTTIPARGRGAGRR